MDRVAIRISRFEDQDAYRRVLDLLVGLYPTRPACEFEVGLARLPCLVSHDADRRAAEALQAALEARGAAVRVLPAESAQSLMPVDNDGIPASQTVSASPEVDLAFLRNSSSSRHARPSGSHRALPSDIRAIDSGDWTHDKAPWEG